MGLCIILLIFYEIIFTAAQLHIPLEPNKQNIAVDPLTSLHLLKRSQFEKDTINNDMFLKDVKKQLQIIYNNKDLFNNMADKKKKSIMTIDNINKKRQVKTVRRGLWAPRASKGTTKNTIKVTRTAQIYTNKGNPTHKKAPEFKKQPTNARENYKLEAKKQVTSTKIDNTRDLFNFNIGPRLNAIGRTTVDIEALAKKLGPLPDPGMFIHEELLLNKLNNSNTKLSGRRFMGTKVTVEPEYEEVMTEHLFEDPLLSDIESALGTKQTEETPF